MGLQKSVLFKGKMPYSEMMQYTQQAQLGLTLDKNTNINYRFSLPNKLFDYIHAGIPVLATKIIEVQKIIEAYNVGLFIENHEPKHIADQIRLALSNVELQNTWSKNIERAAKELNWEQEEIALKEVYTKIEG